MMEPIEAESKVEQLPAVQAQSEEIRVVGNEITPTNLNQKIEQMQAWADFVRKTRVILFKQTQNSDWILQDGKPYLQDQGVTKMRLVAGGELRSLNPNVEKVTAGDGRQDRYYRLSGTYEFHGRAVTVTGTSSTRDPFFAKRKGALIDVDQIDLNDLYKKAETNLYHRAFDKMFGISPTLEELDSFGINPASQIEHKKREVVPDSDSDKKTRVELGRALMAATGNDKEKASAFLKEITAFGDGESAFPGYDSIAKVSAKMLKRALTNAKKGVDGFRKREDEKRAGGK
jgi:hypothetical protein